MIDYNFTTNCPICDSTLTAQFVGEAYYFSCCNNRIIYTLLIKLAEADYNADPSYKEERFSCGNYIIKNLYVEQSKQVNKCFIYKNEYSFDELSLDFILDPKTLTLEKLKSYLMLI